MLCAMWVIANAHSNAIVGIYEIAMMFVDQIGIHINVVGFVLLLGLVTSPR